MPPTLMRGSAPCRCAALLAILLVFSATSSCASAAQRGNYAGYLEATKSNPAIADAYLRGVADAIATVNASVQHIEKRNPSFCPPPMLRLSDGDNERLMKEFMGKHTDLDPRQVSVSSILFLTYKDRFPCRQ